MISDDDPTRWWWWTTWMMIDTHTVRGIETRGLFFFSGIVDLKKHLFLGRCYCKVVKVDAVLGGGAPQTESSVGCIQKEEP